MHESLLLLSLLAVTIALGALAKRFELPYPIVFVIGGAALALVPGLPQIELNPELLFLVVLPPLLYAGGWTTDWTAFRRNLRPIGLLAIGLVIVTTVAVAYVAHALTPELGWASAFALGAIVSPPDAVAAEAVFERFKVPRRVLVILTGEGLVNDATALVIYRFAIVAALTGAFSLANAAVSFVVVALGGIAIGLAIGAGIVAFGKFLDKHNLSDALLDNLTILLAPYAAYLSAEALHVSGVLSAVVAGIFVSRKSSQIYSPDTRLTGIAIWQMMIFVLKALVYLMIGLSCGAIRTARHSRSIISGRASRSACSRSRCGSRGSFLPRTCRGCFLLACGGAIRRPRGSGSSSSRGPACAASSRSRPRWRCRSIAPGGRSRAAMRSCSSRSASSSRRSSCRASP